jgi:hypothetical protein
MTDTDRNGVAPATVEVQASRGRQIIGKGRIFLPKTPWVETDLPAGVVPEHVSLEGLTWGELIGGCILLGAIAGLVLAAILAGGAH